MENCQIQRELLSLPEYVFPAVMLVLGYQTKQQERPKPARCPMKQIVHENGYRSMDAEELHALLGGKAGQRSFDSWCQAFCQRKYNSDFSREMTRSVGEYLTQYQTDFSSEE